MKTLAPLAIALFMSAVTVPASAQRVTDAHRADFVRRLDAHARNEACSAIEAMIDADALIDRGFAGISLPRAERTSVEATLSRALRNQDSGVVSFMCEAVGRFKLRGVGTIDGREVARVRLDSHGRPHFIDFVLGVDRAGNVRATDFYFPDHGGWMSRYLLETVVIIGNATRAYARRLDARGRLLLEHNAKIRSIAELADEGDVEGIKEVVATLPEALQRDWLVFRHRLIASMVSNRGRSDETLAELLVAYPNDTLALTQSYERAASMGRYPEALAFLARLEAVVGADAHFDYLRASWHAREREVNEALELAERAVHADADLAPAWQLLLELYNGRGLYADATRAYVALVRLDELMPSFPYGREYAALRASPEFVAATRGQEEE